MVGYPPHHPVFPGQLPADRAAASRLDVATLMQFGREQIDDFIAARTCHYNIACPNCDGGTRQRAGWQWSVADPDRMTCGYCGLVFPNDNYPLDKVTRVIDSTGVAHEYAYCEGKEGYRHYILMRVDYCKKAYMEHSAASLAGLYAASGEEQYARQAVLILNRLAEAYPHYNVHGITDFTTCAPVIYDLKRIPDPPGGLQPVPGLAKDLKSYETPYPYCSTLRGDGINNWFYDEMSPRLAYAYDLVANSAEFDKLAAALGRDVRQSVKDFFRATANYVRTFPIYLGNMDATLIAGLAVIGRVIGEPEFVHDALRRVKLILGWQFYPDGIWREAAPAYHSHTVHSLRRCVDGPLRGYSDPEGYVNPQDRTHITDLDAAADLPMLQESIDALGCMQMPNGHQITIHDTWAQLTQGKPLSPVRDEPIATHLMWGMGHAIMGVGRGETGVQVNLHFSGSYGHAHADNLDLMLFGAGLEMLSDVGYTHTLLRPLSSSSLAHNLVVVDEADQGGADGSLAAWGVCDDLLQFCEAHADRAYPLASQYRRAVAAVASPESSAYVVDVFRVTGGSKHDWLLHGSADYDQQLDCSLPLRDIDGSLLPSTFKGPLPWTLAAGQGFPTVVNGVNVLYGLLSGLRQAAGDAGWSATFHYAKPGMPALRTSVLGQPGTTVCAAALPSIRRARESSPDVFKYDMPTLLVRREGRDLQSTFAAVHEPYKGTPRITSVEPLDLSGSEKGAVGVVCRGDGLCDYHLFGLDATSSMRAMPGPIRARARYAFVRTRGDRAAKMVIVDGSELAFGDITLSVPAAPEGKVLAVRRVEAGDEEDALVVDTSIAPREGKPHERVVVEFGDGSSFGLAVRRTRRSPDGQSVVVLEHRPGFELSGDGQSAVQTHHPHRVMPGRPAFRFVNIVCWERECKP